MDRGVDPRCAPLSQSVEGEDKLMIRVDECFNGHLCNFQIQPVESEKEFLY